MKRAVDVLVVGAGPAGIGAALAASETGASVLVVDENAGVGGRQRSSIAVQPGTIDELTNSRGVEFAAWAEVRLRLSAVHVVPDAAVWGLFEGKVAGVIARDQSFRVDAGRVIVAAGSTDVVVPFPGWVLPGVMTAGAALRLMHVQRVVPGRRVAVVGSGSQCDELVEALELAGSLVVTRSRTFEGVAVHGSDEVERIDTRAGRFDVDCVVIAAGRLPDPALVLQAGGAIGYSATDGCFVPLRSDTLETSIQGVFAAGSCAGVCGMAEAFAEGSVAGCAAAGGARLARALRELERLRSADRQEQAHRLALSRSAEQAQTMSLAPFPLRMPPFEEATLVCRCEEIAAADVQRTIANGAATPDDVKRSTRAGMGACQGIYCLGAVTIMLQRERGMAIDSVRPMTTRPPARPVPLIALADAGR